MNYLRCIDRKAGLIDIHWNAQYAALFVVLLWNIFSLSAVLCMSDAPVKSSQFLAGKLIISTTNCVALPKIPITILVTGAIVTRHVKKISY